MHKYKITASKSQKKYQFVLSAENEKLAKNRVHKDGYSILSVELYDENSISRNTFIFEAEKKWEIKKWKVVWDDIFKIYLKLKDWLWYKVNMLYLENEITKDDKYKLNIIKDLEEQYLYFNWLNKDKPKEEDKNKKIDKNEINVDNFYLKKQLEETYKLVDFVLLKLKKLLENSNYNLEDSKKEKLKNLYNTLIKIKSSTNILKLREVWEAVLIKIWEIELNYIEWHKEIEWKKFLSETNLLLKQIWSEKKFIEEDKDIKKQFEKFLWFFIEIYEDFKKEKKEKREKNNSRMDKRSHDYLKTLILFNKYKQKLRQNNIEVLKNVFLFILPWSSNSPKKIDLIVRRRVIKQNIFLFKAKLEWSVFSYTKVIKGFDYFLDKILEFFNYIKEYLFFVVLVYCLLFLVFLNLSYYEFFVIFKWTLNYNWIFYFILFLFIYFSIYFSRWLYSLIFNFVILFFITILWVINF